MLNIIISKADPEFTSSLFDQKEQRTYISKLLETGVQRGEQNPFDISKTSNHVIQPLDSEQDRITWKMPRQINLLLLPVVFSLASGLPVLCHAKEVILYVG